MVFDKLFRKSKIKIICGFSFRLLQVKRRKERREMYSKCEGCGKEGLGQGKCTQCQTWDIQMQMVKDAEKFSKTMNIALWGDGGILCCTPFRRRFFFFSLGIIFLVAGAVSYFFFPDAAYACVGIAIIWLLAFCLCPNGPCGMYSANGDWGCLTPSEMVRFFACCFFSSSNTKKNEEKRKISNSKDAQRNIATIQRFIHIYGGPRNNVDEQMMLEFIEQCYEPNYQSHYPTGTVMTKQDLPKIYRDAWGFGRRAYDLRIIEAGDKFVSYSYRLTMEDGKDFGLKSLASFQNRPGVLFSANFTYTK